MKKDYIILQNPLQYSQSDYERVRDKVVNMFKRQADVISISQIGSLSTPGISDLDLVLVFRDNVQGIDFTEYYNQFDNRDRYILMHSPFVISKTLFENMRYFYIPGEFKLLWGEHLQIKPIRPIQPMELMKATKSIAPVKLLELLIATEYILGLFFVILHTLNTRVIKIRSLLCGISALKYDLEILGLNNNNFPDGIELLNRVSQLRKEWFELEDGVRIREFTSILKDYPDLLLKILLIIEDKIASFSPLHSSFPLPTGERIKVRSGGENRNVFCIKYGINNYVLKSPNRKCDFLVKKGFWPLFLEKLPYSKLTYDTEWVLSEYIIKVPFHLFSLLSGSINSDYKAIFEKRRELIADYLSFYKKFTGFGVLLPPLSAPLPIVNLKWRGLIFIRDSLKNYKILVAK